MAEELDKLIDLHLLDALFDEWMHTQFHTVQASGTKVVCIDKDGTRTETDDLAGASKQAKAEWDNTYRPQFNSDHATAVTTHQIMYGWLPTFRGLRRL